MGPRSAPGVCLGALGHSVWAAIPLSVGCTSGAPEQNTGLPWLRQPGDPGRRTRGVATPPYDGCARSVWCGWSVANYIPTMP